MVAKLSSERQAELRADPRLAAGPADHRYLLNRRISVAEGVRAQILKLKALDVSRYVNKDSYTEKRGRMKQNKANPLVALGVEIVEALSLENANPHELTTNVDYAKQIALSFSRITDLRVDVFFGKYRTTLTLFNGEELTGRDTWAGALSILDALLEVAILVLEERKEVYTKQLQEAKRVPKQFNEASPRKQKYEAFKKKQAEVYAKKVEDVADKEDLRAFGLRKEDV